MKVLSGVETNLMSLDAEIARLQAQRAECITRVEELRMAIAPHERLPPEIIALIFVHCAADHAISLPPSRSSMTHPPWVLRHVCVKWRDIALNERRLWNWIAVQLPKMGQDERLRTILDLFHRLLPSTGPVSISVSGSNNYHPLSNDGSYFQIAIDSIIKPNIARIRGLDLTLPTSGFCEFFKLPSSSFTSLECMRIGFRTGCVKSIDHVGMAPKIRQLKVSECPGRLFGLMQPQVPWHQLTDLELVGIPSLRVSIAYDILQQCTLLETCTIQVIWYCRAFQPPGMVTLPHAKSMKLSIPCPSFLDCFILPSLTDLCIEVRDYEPFPVQQIISVITRSACLLRVLAQTEEEGIYEPCAPNELDELLGLVPSLEELEVPQVTFPASTLRKIGCGELLPRLRILKCCPKPLDAFLDMLEDRLSSSAPSKKFHTAYMIYPINLPGHLMPTAARREKMKHIYGSDLIFETRDYY